MERPTFTTDQENWICEVIGDWYLAWKHKICHKDGTHNLGRAKEQLKALICNDVEFFRSEFAFYQLNEEQE
jgi:hypothetical protein